MRTSRTTETDGCLSVRWRMRVPLIVGLVTLSAPLEAQVGFLDEEIVHAGILRNHGEFGRSADVCGDLAIFGSPEAFNRGIRKGRAGIYRFHGDRWRFEQEVHPTEPPPHGRFGVSAAIDGASAAVGAQGRVYVFERQGVRWTQSLRAVGSNAQFGQVLDLRGDSLLARSGLNAVSVYTANPWRGTGTLAGPGGSSFGEAIDLSDENLAAIGAPFDDGATAGSGAVYVYRRNGVDWTLEQKIVGSDSLAGDQFGQAVSIHGDLLVVGAMMHDRVGKNDAGAVYVYHYDGATWVEEKKLRRGSPWLGTDVATNGERIFAAANGYGWYGVHSWIRDGGSYRYDGEIEKALVHRNYPVDKYLEVDGGTLVMGESLKSKDHVLHSGRARIRSFLELTIEPDRVPPGSIVHSLLRGADPRTPYLIAITSAQSRPVFWEVARGTFDEHRQAQSTLPIPPGMTVDLQFTAWALPAGGVAVASDVETLIVR